MGKKNIFIIYVLMAMFCGAVIFPSSVRAQSDEDRFENARQKWEEMSPEQKKQYRARMDKWKNLDPQEKKKIRQRFDQYKKMPPEKKKT